MERIDASIIPPECIKDDWELIDDTPYFMDGVQFALFSLIQAVRRRDEEL